MRSRWAPPRVPAWARCRRNWRARRTASRWPATATIKAVQDHNATVRSFPSNLTAMAFSFKVKPNSTVENEREISTECKVDFGAGSAKPHGEIQSVAR